MWWWEVQLEWCEVQLEWWEVQERSEVQQVWQKALVWAKRQGQRGQ